jgi:very-short-patch-repair endonuclease
MRRQLRLDRSNRDDRARELRHQMSKSEWRLWYHLRDRQLGGSKFRRQVPLGPYFADFACLEARLVVEVDGDHADQIVYDARRDGRLNEIGYRVLRFGASEIDENVEGVVETISEALNHGPPPTSPRTPGGGR